MHNSSKDESYIVNRYRLWQRWQPNYSYKQTKGARLARIIDQTGPRPRLALELGVGPGGVAAELSRRGFAVVGIDLSSDALVRAQEHCRGTSVSLMRASGFSLPFQNKSLDLIYASQVLHLFDSAGRLAIMNETHRALRSGGRFVFDLKNASSHPSRYFSSSPERRRRNFPTAAEITGLLKDCGFSTVLTRPGVLPVIKWPAVPDSWIFRKIAHTTFFVAVKP